MHNSHYLQHLLGDQDVANDIAAVGGLLTSTSAEGRQQ